METVLREEEVYTYCKDVPTILGRWKEIITYIMIIYSLLNINVWQWESIKNRQKTRQVDNHRYCIRHFAKKVSFYYTDQSDISLLVESIRKKCGLTSSVRPFLFFDTK